MTPILVIVGVIVALRVVAGMMTPDEPEPAASTSLPPPPRRPRRRGPPRIPAPTVAEPARQAEPDDEGPAAPPPPRVQPVRVARRASPFAFRGREDARRAVVMREVLGPPLSLRR